MPTIKPKNELIEAQQIDQQTVARQKEALRRATESLRSHPALLKDNLGELYARAYAQECLQGMMNIARDMTIDPKIRHQAYLDVYQSAYGRPAAMVKAPAELGPNLTIDGEIAKAQDASIALNLLAEYAATPPELWPEELRKMLNIEESKDPQP